MDSVARCHHPGHGPAGEGTSPAFEAIEIERVSDEIAITKLDLEIAPMQEFQTRLVADVVTGKLDVRPAARQLRDAGEHLVDSTPPDEDGDETVGPEEEAILATRH